MIFDFKLTIYIKDIIISLDLFLKLKGIKNMEFSIPQKNLNSKSRKIKEGLLWEKY